MGVGGIGVGSLVLILLIVILLFGTKKLRNIGSDLGGGLRNFKKAMKDGEETKSEEQKLEQKSESSVIEGEATKEKDKSNT